MLLPKIPSIAELLAAGKPAELPPAPDLQGWNSDHPIFDRLVAETSPHTIVEVGTWKGRSAAHFASASAGLTEPDDVSGIAVPLRTSIYCVDTWLGGFDHLMATDRPVNDVFRDPFGSPRLYHQFLRNFADGEWARHAARIFPVQNTSLNGARLLFARQVRAPLIYIDGSHEYEDAYADICAYAHLLTPGGVIFGDDFRGCPGVFAAVLRFAHETSRTIEEVDHNFWILRTP